MHMPVYTYCAVEIDQNTWFPITTDPCWPNEHVASEAGKDYHENYDGWEIEYPITIALRNELGADVGQFVVGRQMEPVFSAHAKTK